MTWTLVTSRPRGGNRADSVSSDEILVRCVTHRSFSPSRMVSGFLAAGSSSAFGRPCDAGTFVRPTRPAARGPARAQAGAGEAPVGFSVGERPTVASHCRWPRGRGEPIRRGGRVQADSRAQEAWARHGAGHAVDRFGIGSAGAGAVDACRREGKRFRAGLVSSGASPRLWPGRGRAFPPPGSKRIMGVSPAGSGEGASPADRGSDSPGPDRSAGRDAVSRPDGSTPAGRSASSRRGERSPWFHDPRGRRGLRRLAGRGAQRPDPDSRRSKALSPKPAGNGRSVSSCAGDGGGVSAGCRDGGLSSPAGPQVLARRQGRDFDRRQRTNRGLSQRSDT